MVESGILLIKYWLEVGPEEQTRRLEGRINDPRKIWKLSDMDLKSYSRWFDYSRARDDMLRATDTSWAPWYVAHTDDKKRGRLNIITHLLSLVPYEPLPKRDIELPKRQSDQRLRRTRTASALRPGEVLSRPALSGQSDHDDARKADDDHDSTGRHAAADRARGTRCRPTRWPAGSGSMRRPGCPQPQPPSGCTERAERAARREDRPGWRRFLAQYAAYMQIILVIAGVLSLAIGQWSTGPRCCC